MLQFKYRATFEDGGTFEVTADQRDVAAFEIEPFGCSYHEYKSRLFTAARYLAWHAGKRAGLTKLSWDKFGEQCKNVEDISGEDDAPEASDPGQSAASAES